MEGMLFAIIDEKIGVLKFYRYNDKLVSVKPEKIKVSVCSSYCMQEV